VSIKARFLLADNPEFRDRLRLEGRHTAQLVPG
jgi:hypothetical protein